MSREVKKKNLDHTLQFSDDFDEDMLDIIEKKHFDAEPGFENEAQAESLPSLDNLENNVPSPEPDESAGEPDSNPPSEEDTTKTAPEVKSFFERINRKRRIQIGSALILLALISVLSWVYFHHLGSETGKPITMIRHQIIFPHLQQTSTFILYVDTGQRKDLFELSMEFEFFGETLPLEIQEKGIVFRDEVYKFLQSRKPPESSYKYWEKIVQKDLQIHLETSFPKSFPRSIRLAHFGRL